MLKHYSAAPMAEISLGTRPSPSRLTNNEIMKNKNKTNKNTLLGAARLKMYLIINYVNNSSHYYRRESQNQQNVF